ncbi:MAG: DUF302 domain-containing protein [Ignavibacteria bacterium]|nr:DUF302 domain-containing protein [Ignavibacteria bacterium]
MKYYREKQVTGSFQDVLAKIPELLKKEGFGILTDTDIQSTLKTKLNADFRPYRILGACNPPFAYKALQEEENIGLLLPCNIVVQELPGENVKVSVINPLATMQIADNEAIESIAREVADRLERFLESL